MKVLKQKDTNVVIVVSREISEVENGYLKCDDIIYSDCNIQNCDIADTLVYPDKFVGGCYTHDSATDTFTCIDTKTVEGFYPLPKITMCQARLELLSRGLLDMATSIASLSPALQVEFEYATEIRRDNELFKKIQTAAGLSDSAMDDLFAKAALR